jgi:hypothetical protein
MTSLLFLLLTTPYLEVRQLVAATIVRWSVIGVCESSVGEAAVAGGCLQVVTRRILV